MLSLVYFTAFLIAITDGDVAVNIKKSSYFIARYNRFLVRQDKKKELHKLQEFEYLQEIF